MEDTVMKKSTNKKLLKPILIKLRKRNMKNLKIKTKSKPDTPAKTINYEFFQLQKELVKYKQNLKK